MNALVKNTGFIISVLILTSSFLIKEETENNWPREIDSKEGTIIIYQPEIESLINDKMESRSAVSITTNDNPTPVFGAMWFDCRISTDRDERTVTLLNLKVVAANFPDIEESEVKKIEAFIEKEVPKWEMEMSLDEILAGMDLEDNQLTEDEKLNNDAPEIIFKTAPTALIYIDGEPSFKKIEKSNYEYVVNTPFFIVKDTKTGNYYLRGGEFWYISQSLNDNWKITSNVPDKMVELSDESFEEIDNSEDIFENQDELSPPEIVLRTTPTELLQSNGKPEYSTIKGTSLLYMTNTDDDIIMNISTQEYFILISGRWYKSKGLESNQWTFIPPDEVPDDFSKIPEDSPVSNIRANIYGTQESKEAVLETQIPQTAEIDRNSATVDVSYDGEAKFDPIEGTEMYYAVNTSKPVLLIDGRYYCCDNAVWFEGASPIGPWKVSVEIPREQIRRIPPRYPVYNVRYVYIYDYSPTVVRVGYTPGYVHSYVYRGCVFYGTGYYYQPWYRTYYYPRHVTYGFRVHYSPYSGWGFSYGPAYRGHRWVRSHHHHHYYHGYWGPSGYRHTYRHAQHHGYKRGYYQGISDSRRITYTSSAGRRSTISNNVYVNRSSGVTQTGKTTYNPRTGQRVTVTQTSTRLAKPSTRSNNVYSDRNGNVYRRTTSGNWEQRSNGNWQSRSTTTRTTSRTTTVNRQQSTTNRQNQTRTNPTTTRTTTQTPGRQSQQGKTLNNQYSSRSRSTQRTQNYNQNKRQHQYSGPSKSSSNARTSGNNKTTRAQTQGSSRSSSTNRKSSSNNTRR